MRLLTKLLCVENSHYEMQYHYYLQGFIYNLLKGSKYDYIHNKKGYKFFCFSNIFPATMTLEKNDSRTLIISSPDSEFVTYLHEVMRVKIWDSAEVIKIGSMKFKIEYVDKLVQKIPSNKQVTLIAGTPIIVRIPSDKYRKHGVHNKKGYEYIYWRHDHPIDLFISQLQNNLLNKYYKYYGASIRNDSNIPMLPASRSPSTPPLSIFQKFRFRKQISTKIFMKNFEQVIIGTVWEFGFSINSNKDLIQFGLDAGLGERNSLGFGFMNIKD